MTRNEKPPRAPPLKNLSDVLFIEWQSLGGDIQNLKYFFRLHIKNLITQARIKDAVGPVVPRWPGRTFKMEDKKDKDKKGLALLGTPNGIGVAYFLIQHKKQLGVRAPFQVTVWSTPSLIEGEEDYFHILFYIGKVKKPTN
ncbi:hypothetical protein N7475_003696 [Penicillium sp. IBT 31633x]|nr:hypothetical protein N7475_003696 [Penicillium sp. IBT 31633x]